MITCMLAGQLAKQLETRTSKNDNPYTTATLHTQEGEDAVFASVTAFGDLAGPLVGLAKGDPITVVGSGTVSTYTGLSIAGTRVIALTDHQAPPTAPSPKGHNGQRRCTADTQVGPRELAPDKFTDTIPF